LPYRPNTARKHLHLTGRFVAATLASRLKTFAWKAFQAAGARLASPLDQLYLARDIPQATLTGHQGWGEHLVGLGNRAGLRILEIGSREVTGPNTLRRRFDQATYVGFDYYPGANVDVVGDAHRLSDYFDQPFDIIYTTAVFEHLAMPWLVAEEIAKVLKVGGLLMVETHFSYSAHERPWNFFQFSDMGLKVLFGPPLGFECLEASMQNPIVGRFSRFADRYLRFQPVTGLYCHAAFLGRKVRQVDAFQWRADDVPAMVSGTLYPPPAVGP
jgi:SAM-dependent methyltransferase